MKSPLLLFAAFLLTVSTGLAEPPAKKEEPAKQEKPAVEPAEAWVAKLYALAKNNKGPFFQTKDKATLNRWLAKDLADLVLKDGSIFRDSSRGQKDAI